MKLCPRCIARGKTWEGGDPKCSFPNEGLFTAEGWNCATANALRQLCGGVEGLFSEPDEPVTMHGKEQAYAIRWDDDSWGVINIIGIDLERDHYKTLWLSWYKNRGRTDAVLLLSDDGSEIPTYADCDAILKHFEQASATASSLPAE